MLRKKCGDLRGSCLEGTRKASLAPQMSVLIRRNKKRSIEMETFRKPMQVKLRDIGRGGKVTNFFWWTRL